MNRLRTALVVLFALSAVLFLAACGGGGSSTPPPPPPPPPPQTKPLSITTLTLPTMISEVAYSAKLEATGGKLPYTWSADPPLPPGISVSSSGEVKGTPVWNQGPSNLGFWATVQDSAGSRASDVVTVLLESQLKLNNPELTAANVALAYSYPLWISGGNGTYTCAVEPNGGALPPGLSLTSQCAIAGTPTADGTYNFTVKVTDTGTPQLSMGAALTLTVNDNVIVTSPNWLPLGVQNATYSTSLSAVGGTPPYSWSVAGGTVVPPGLSLSTSGVISGTPTTSGSFPLTVQAGDSSNPQKTGQMAVILPINAPLSVAANLYDAVQDGTYPWAVWAQGGLPPYTSSITSGSLPPGLALQSESQQGGFSFNGAPTSTGSYSFTVTLADHETPAASASGAFTIRVFSPLTYTGPKTLQPGIVGQPYSVQLSASGGLPPYQWAQFYGPSGLSLDPATGLISGTPSTAYDWAASLNLSDSANLPQMIGAWLPLRIADPLKLGTSQLPAVAEGSPVNLQLTLTGGTGPFAWSLTSGSLPDRLTLNSTGAITGTPTAAGSYPFTITVNDPGPPAQVANVNLTLTVSATPGRNDTIANATPLSNGTYAASISPMVDPPGSLANPDVDVYKLLASPGAVVRIETFADRLAPASPMDSVLEVMDAAGTRLQTCGYNDFDARTSPCMSDDISLGFERDSLLFFQADPSASGPVTFYVRVSDWTGGARPDLLYEISVSGAN